MSSKKKKSKDRREEEDSWMKHKQNPKEKPRNQGKIKKDNIDLTTNKKSQKPTKRARFSGREYN